MYGFPRSQFHLQPQYGSRQTIPFHSGLYGATIQPPMPPHSYFGIPTNGMPTAVQEYLDINCNQNYGESHERVKCDISLAESSFQCKPCKKSFQDKNRLTVHLKTHVKCEFPNCVFIASRQTLKLHEIQCHREGKMKIVLDTPEQITKWREERKRNYPTVTNVTRKEAQQRQKNESGEILTTKEFRYNRKQGWKQQRRKNKRGIDAQREDNAASTQLKNVTLSTVDLLPEKRSEGFTLKDGNLLDLNRNNAKCEENAGVSLLNLGSLAADYATSSSDEDNNIEQKDVAEKSAQSEHFSKPEKKRQRSKENHDKQSQRKNSQARSRKKHTQPQNNAGSNRPRPTLLEMLLAPDIRHERNVMLQCIRFIVRKNFFGIE